MLCYLFFIVFSAHCTLLLQKVVKAVLCISSHLCYVDDFAPFFLTLPALFGEHNAGEQWSGILMANYKMPFLWKKYQRNPSEICSKFREIENILLSSIFSWVEFETHRS